MPKRWQKRVQTILKEFRKIAANNAKLKRVSKPQTRVLIAKDALKWLECGLFRIEMFTGYLKLPDVFDDIKEPAVQAILAEFEAEEDTKALDVNILARAALSTKNKPECTVCALGGLLCAGVLRYDNVDIDDDAVEVGYSDDVGLRTAISIEPQYDYNKPTYDDAELHLPLLNDYFSAKQLALIEIAFEGWAYGKYRNLESNAPSDFCHQPLTAKETAALATFGERYKKPVDRFKAICRNIIRNNGTFKP